MSKKLKSLTPEQCLMRIREQIRAYNQSMEALTASEELMYNVEHQFMLARECLGEIDKIVYSSVIRQYLKKNGDLAVEN